MSESQGFTTEFLGAVTVGKHGQVVIPIKARELCGISPGEKLLVFVVGPRHLGLAFIRPDWLEDARRIAEALASRAFDELS
jgi:AbrB family looped-hinge helix DNA binding protein